MPLTSPPPRYSWVPTEDGSQTLFSELYQESCHSTHGAKAETLLHYIQGCKIIEKANLGEPFTILEVGFGLGLGFLTTFESLKETQTSWHFVSLEIDRTLVQWFIKENPDLELLKHSSWSEHIFTAVYKNVSLTIVTGDARVSLPLFLKSHPLKWNAIYQDAFSPKKNPVLWTKEWFELLKDHSSPDVILSTYSASISIRKSLREAGFQIQAGEKFGPKRTSTRATLSGISDPIILDLLERSPTHALTDESIKDLQ